VPIFLIYKELYCLRRQLSHGTVCFSRFISLHPFSVTSFLVCKHTDARTHISSDALGFSLFLPTFSLSLSLSLSVSSCSLSLSVSSCSLSLSLLRTSKSNKHTATIESMPSRREEGGLEHLQHEKKITLDRLPLLQD